MKEIRETCGIKQLMAESINEGVAPPFYLLRRVPTRYRKLVPLRLMRRYRCLVVGAAPGVLTLAIADKQNTAAVEVVERLTRRTVFPVLMEPARLRMLLYRMRRFEQYGQRPQIVFQMLQMRAAVKLMLGLRTGWRNGSGGR